MSVLFESSGVRSGTKFREGRSAPFRRWGGEIRSLPRPFPSLRALPLLLAFWLPFLSCASATTRFTGCMAKESATPVERNGFDQPSYFLDETDQGPPAELERKGASARLEVKKRELFVQAFFSHACCRRGSLRTRREGKEGEKLILRISLSGRTCRCRCFSGMETSLKLHPGSYRVLLFMEGEPDPLLDEAITIPQ